MKKTTGGRDPAQRPPSGVLDRTVAMLPPRTWFIGQFIASVLLGMEEIYDAGLWAVPPSVALGAFALAGTIFTWRQPAQARQATAAADPRVHHVTIVCCRCGETVPHDVVATHAHGMHVLAAPHQCSDPHDRASATAA